MQAQNRRYKTTGNRGLFDEQETYQKLSAIGYPLEMISKVIGFEMFRDMLEAKLLNTNKKNNAGAKPFDVVMMFKIMILQRYYRLGDTQIESQILDRLSFKKFLHLESGDKVPDEKTVWAFREKLTNEGLVEDIFLLIDNYKVTDASVHDSQPLDDLLTEDDSGQDFFADSAYSGEAQEKVIAKYKMNNKVHELSEANHEYKIIKILNE